MASKKFLKLYRVKHINVWPYEDVQSTAVVSAKSPILLTAEMHDDSSIRCYRRHPGQFAELSLVEPYGDWEGADDGREISPYQVFADRPIALQIDYVVFQSWRGADYAKIEPVIERVKHGGLAALKFPSDLRPDRAVVQGDKDSDPRWAWINEGQLPPEKPRSTFLASERSSIPYINDHTIPKGIDYQCVYAGVMDYRLYDIPPTWDEVMTRLGRYCAWFEKFSGRKRRK